ncbi:MAG TPA: DegV family protein [Candidatus Pullilachnospira stercoravium]|uniref:DegV family protein n=1 Tax=Candidatus Pullilachnospira stercoravium TaxID=2840913 RepID=A0A9D1NWL4_9FIRM|nr:DegV family protein [Candidatus Pullilachnospira stercoravium]
MSRVAIVTDSNSGISQEEAKKLGVYVVPMPFFVNGRVYFEDIDLSQEQFYKLLAEDADVSTSQPSPADIMDLWDDLLRSHQEIVHIPMSSGLSASCATAQGLAQDYNGKVQVVDNKRVSVTMMQSVLDALALAKSGKSAAQIREILERESLEASIYLMVDTLKYLKKGGRITPAAAMIGSVLKLKPVLQIHGDKLDAYAKVRGVKAAKKTMLDAIKKDLEGRFASYMEKGEMKLQVAYTTLAGEAEAWMEEVKAAFPDLEITRMDPLALSIVCHTGPGVLAVTATHVINPDNV